MKRFRPWLLDGFAMLSILLCLATAIQWRRSYRTEDDLVHFGHPLCGALHTMNGSLAFVYTNAIWSNPHFEYSTQTPRAGINYANPSGKNPFWGRLGFCFIYGSGPTNLRQNRLPPGMSYPPVQRFCEILVPLWFVMLLCAAFPVWRFVVEPVRSPKQPGCCPVCGYDLRATPDRCPECGTIPPKKEIISNCTTTEFRET
jgi:hypothetical protein